MKLFKKTYEYSIYCGTDMNERVRKFAEKHSVPGTVVETRAHGPLLSKNLRVTVIFKSNDHEALLYRDLIEVFKNCDLKIHGRRISILKEEGF